MGLIDRYILRATATPLILALTVAGMLLLIEHMLRLFDFVLTEQGPIDVVWRLLSNLVPHYFGLALPLGTFLGVMLAFRNFSLSSELDAMSSSGASFGRLLRPIYALVVFLLIFDFLLVSYIQPFARYKYQQTRFNVTSGALGIKIPAGEFVDISDELTIRLGAINRETRDAEDIFLEQRGAQGGKTTITAQYGAISTTPDISNLLLKLRDGRQVFLSPEGDRIQTLNFDNLDLSISLPAIGVFRERGDNEREATLNEIVSLLSSQQPQTTPLYNNFRAGFHWRLIHPLTFLVLPILAVAMGVTGRRRTSNLKPVLGVAMLIVYHEVLEEWGKTVVSLNQLSPYVAMWGVFALFTAVSIYLYSGAIDQARTARLMARRAEPAVRVVSSRVDETAPAPAFVEEAMK
ncbi:MAG: LptF/LptG family permease [Parvularculaceae bacterium]